ncbi:PorT family protein [Aquimarina sp. U1-2]|uniref:porin family protein n=1 Tax=Aquimarina sp. U1-2 TaxID=2823141 RepID=UPI001AECAF7D|nr:porin family protein [Aquimarina sp. U1-2]MBP2833532.1 PorT family protein [Aquimarina sp. U1-2]
MQKQTVLFILMLTYSALVLAQQDEDPLYTRAGFKIGLNYANLAGDIDDTEARIRMHLGAVIEFPVSSRFYVQTEILYSAQGYTVDENGIDNKVSLNYLALPIIAKYYFTPRFSLETGPRFATLASSSQSEGEETDAFFDTFENFDFGWNFGVGYKAESGLFFQLHYVLGINEVIDTNVLDISANTSMFQLSVGYLFKTKNNRRQQPAVQQ